MSLRYEQKFFHMNIELKQGFPSKIGYYVIKYTKLGGPHLVLIGQEISEDWTIDNGSKFFYLKDNQRLFKNAFYSEAILTVIKDNG